MTDFHSFVRRRLSYSLIWSTAARVTTCILQIVSIPIAVKYLGVEGYAAYMAIFAISLAPHAFVLRHGPSLTGPVAVLMATDDWQRIREKLWSAFIPSLLTAIAAGDSLSRLLFAMESCVFPQLFTCNRRQVRWPHFLS